MNSSMPSPSGSSSAATGPGASVWSRATAEAAFASPKAIGSRSAIKRADLPDEAPDGSILETRPAAQTLLHELARRAALAPLAALIIDYGHDETGFGDTLQAVRGHRFAATLADPGSADLSAHVDFADLKRQASALGLKPYGPMPQGEFLLKLGLGERRNRLLQRATPAQAEAIASGASRLVDPKQMGILFKVLALTERRPVRHPLLSAHSI